MGIKDKFSSTVKRFEHEEHAARFEGGPRRISSPVALGGRGGLTLLALVNKKIEATEINAVSVLIKAIWDTKCQYWNSE